MKINISELLAQLLGETYAPKEILEENKLIHAKLGLEAPREYCKTLGGLEAFKDREHGEQESNMNRISVPICFVFRPDAVGDDVVYELKVQRRYSDRRRLIFYGFLQLQLELYALGFKRGRLLVYHYDSGELEEYEVDCMPEVAQLIMAWWVGRMVERGEIVEELEERVFKHVKP